MDRPELSLGPSLSKEGSNNGSSASEDDTMGCRKRKCNWDELTIHNNIELQLKDPLPLDWEQCLDLQSGRMYYLNRRTLKKSWDWPRDHQKLDLELNMSPFSISSDSKTSSMAEQTTKKKTSSSYTNMVAIACLKCHLLVMLCKSSPSCPNCKHVHSLSSLAPVTMNQQQQGFKSKMANKSSLETLSLLN
ncbi:hypothetical protein QJS10_CPA16g00161 [Acorus calamus]|uniref:WW domain-containing protein n=1 Tax=Acorus calamus TaxID=4465 RepID=A0AAV9D1T1_ACOCL|nr:hypothetical protein QJS10_CPA16g00161 [Acorus calamus]